MGRYFETRLESLLELPLTGDVRGMCLLICIEYVKDPQTREALPKELGVGQRIARACEERGLLVRPMGNMLALSPALVITESQVDFVVETIRDATRQVTDALTRAGHL